jgi:tripartite-type tricarboxylate transporter receptor subunit TctC
MRCPGETGFRPGGVIHLPNEGGVMSRTFVVALLVALPLMAHGQAFPTKPIRIVDPFPPGGASDQMARILAQRLSAKWGQPVIVDNRAGAGGNVGAEAVYGAEPDGHTLLNALPPLVVNKRLFSSLAYDPDAFVPVSLIAIQPIVLTVNPKVNARSVQELIALAKANPGKLNYASQGNGTSAHLTGELFNSMAGLKVVHVPYKGSAPALTDLIGGQVEMMFVPLGASSGHISAGKIRALAVGTPERAPSLPDVPAMAETLPGFFAAAWVGLVAPPKTPVAVVNRLSAAIAEELRQPDVAKRLSAMGAVPAGSTPAATAQFLKQEAERWGAVITSAGIKAE